MIVFQNSYLQNYKSIEFVKNTHSIFCVYLSDWICLFSGLSNVNKAKWYKHRDKCPKVFQIHGLYPSSSLNWLESVPEHHSSGWFYITYLCIYPWACVLSHFSHIQLFVLYIIIFIFNWWLLYNIGLISVIHQHKLTIGVHRSPPLEPPSQFCGFIPRFLRTVGHPM